MRNNHKIEEVVVIINNSYNLQEWEKKIIERCIEDNPSFSKEELAAYLNMSERWLFRKLKDYNIDLSISAKRQRLANFLQTHQKSKHDRSTGNRLSA